MLRNGRLTPLILLAAAAACADAHPRFVTVGDNTASAPTYATSNLGLLIENNDALFPMFSGRSLTARLRGAAQIVRLDRGGDSFHNLAEGDTPWCTCTGDACAAMGEACLDTTAHDDTTIIVQLGGNDLVTAFLALVDNEALRADPQPLFDQFRADVRTVLGALRGAPLFPIAPLRILVLNVYDPSDGVGDVANIAARVLPPSFGIDPTVVSAELGKRVISTWNRIISDEVQRFGLELVDAHGHFLGHGDHFDDPEHANYRPDDPTSWLRGALDPTLRGAHELRRLLWRSLYGEDVSTIPTDLPVPGLLELPAVPMNGWAKAVVDSQITAMIRSEALDLDWPNLSADPQLAVGAPTGGADDAVAVGVRGAFLVLDLGADTAATDGAGEDLVVLEFGALSGGVPEPYRVAVANDPAGPFTTLADGRGERAFDLATAGIKSARYVRIESQAATVDVLQGLGSPTAPGPEIDAIGAVYPGSP